MQNNVPMWKAAGYLGMSEKTLRDTYGCHHADHLRGAANAIGAKQKLPAQSLIISLVEEKAKRQKAHP